MSHLDWNTCASLYQSGMTLHQVAREVGGTPSGVANALRRCGVPRRGRGRPKGSTKPPHERPRSPHLDFAIEMRLRGWTLQKIGDARGITRERVRQLLKQSGVVLPPRPHTATRCRHVTDRAQPWCSDCATARANRPRTWTCPRCQKPAHRLKERPMSLSGPWQGVCYTCHAWLNRHGWHPSQGRPWPVRTHFHTPVVYDAMPPSYKKRIKRRAA